MGCSGCGGRSYTRKTPTMAMPMRRESHAPMTNQRMATPQSHAPTQQPRVVQSTTLANRRAERRQI
jgi:hypothetical protein